MSWSQPTFFFVFSFLVLGSNPGRHASTVPPSYIPAQSQPTFSSLHISWDSMSIFPCYTSNFTIMLISGVHILNDHKYRREEHRLATPLTQKPCLHYSILSSIYPHFYLWFIAYNTWYFLIYPKFHFSYKQKCLYFIISGKLITLINLIIHIYY
jgi:hypothetical protein